MAGFLDHYLSSQDWSDPNLVENRVDSKDTPNISLNSKRLLDDRGSDERNKDINESAKDALDTPVDRSKISDSMESSSSETINHVGLDPIGAIDRSSDFESSSESSFDNEEINIKPHSSLKNLEYDKLNEAQGSSGRKSFSYPLGSSETKGPKTVNQESDDSSEGRPVIRIPKVGSQGTSSRSRSANEVDDKSKSLVGVSVRNSWLFHLVNVILHSVVTATYVGMLRNAGINKLARLLSGVLFALHPVHCEAVASVVGRAELLSGLFFCLSLSAYLRYLAARYEAVKKQNCSSLCLGILFAAAAWAALGVMCKEQAVCAMAVGALVHASVVIGKTPLKSSLMISLLAELWPTAILGLTLLCLRVKVSPNVPSFTAADNPAAHATNPLTRVLTITQYWFLHCQILLFPNTLSFDWSMDAIPLVTSVLDSRNLGTIVMFITLLALTGRWLETVEKQRRKTSHGIKLLKNIRGKHADDRMNNNTIVNCVQIRHRPQDPLWGRGSWEDTEEQDPLCEEEEAEDSAPKSFLEDGSACSAHQLCLALGLLVIPFLPSSNLGLWVGFTVAERILYIPSMGSCLLIGLGAALILNRWGRSVTIGTPKNGGSGKAFTKALQHLPHFSPVSSHEGSGKEDRLTSFQCLDEPPYQYSDHQMRTSCPLNLNTEDDHSQSSSYSSQSSIEESSDSHYSSSGSSRSGSPTSSLDSSSSSSSSSIHQSQKEYFKELHSPSVFIKVGFNFSNDDTSSCCTKPAFQKNSSAYFLQPVESSSSIFSRNSCPEHFSTVPLHVGGIARKHSNFHVKERCKENSNIHISNSSATKDDVSRKFICSSSIFSFFSSSTSCIGNKNIRVSSSSMLDESKERGRFNVYFWCHIKIGLLVVLTKVLKILTSASGPLLNHIAQRRNDGTEEKKEIVIPDDEEKLSSSSSSPSCSCSCEINSSQIISEGHSESSFSSLPPIRNNNTDGKVLFDCSKSTFPRNVAECIKRIFLLPLQRDVEMPAALQYKYCFVDRKKRGMDSKTSRRGGNSLPLIKYDRWDATSRYSLLTLAMVATATLLFGAKTLRRNLDWESDESLYKAGIAVNPAKALANLGVVYSDSGRLKLAELAYQSALSHAPNMADTHYNLGVLQSSLHRNEDSIASFTRALASRPWLAQAHLGLASSLFKAGRSKEATAVLEECVMVGNAPAKDGCAHQWAVTTCRQRLARSYILDQKPGKALSQLTLAVSEAPPGYPVHGLFSLKGEAHLAAGELAQAKEILLTALEEQPSHVPTLLAFSRLLRVNGSGGAEAEAWLQRAVALAPQDPHAHKHLGQLLLEQNRIPEALQVWLKASALDPLDHTTAFNTATAFRLAGDNANAEVHYRLAVKLNPQDVSSQRNLGAILHLTGQLSEAATHYEEALRLAPGDPQTLTNLERLSSLASRQGR